MVESKGCPIIEITSIAIVTNHCFKGIPINCVMNNALGCIHPYAVVTLEEVVRLGWGKVVWLGQSI